MYQHLCITIACKKNMLHPVSLAARDNGIPEKIDHECVLKTTEADDITQELALLTSIVNERVPKLESLCVGFNIVYKRDMLVATYLLRAH